jgi:hypothetical protein
MHVRNRVDWYQSEADGTIVVEILTNGEIEENENGPKVRIYLNDEVLFENPPYPSDHEFES